MEKKTITFMVAVFVVFFIGLIFGSGSKDDTIRYYKQQYDSCVQTASKDIPKTIEETMVMNGMFLSYDKMDDLGCNLKYRDTKNVSSSDCKALTIIKDYYTGTSYTVEPFTLCVCDRAFK